MEAIRSLVYFIHLLRREHDDFYDEVILKIWIDNSQALKNDTGDFKLTTPRLTLTPEYDIIQDIHNVCLSEQIRLLGSHVKSHQDDASDRPLEVELNEACDKLAKKFVKTATEVESTRPTAAVAPNATVSLIIENRVVTNRHRERLSLASSTPDLRDYICRRNSWNEETSHLVDWEHFHAALETVFKASQHRFSHVGDEETIELNKLTEICHTKAQYKTAMENTMV